MVEIVTNPHAAHLLILLGTPTMDFTLSHVLWTADLSEPPALLPLELPCKEIRPVTPERRIKSSEKLSVDPFRCESTLESSDWSDFH